MKRGTGSNITDTVAKESILSIQLSLNGLYFCVSRYGQPLWLAHEGAHPGENIPQVLLRITALHEELRYPYRRLRVVVDTERASLVPAEYDREDAVSDYLRMNEISFSPEEDVLVRAGEHKGIVGMICLSSGVADVLARLFPDSEIAYTHPLLLAMRRSGRGPVTDICLSEDGFLHLLIVPEDKPVYAATLPCGGTEALLFLLSTLKERFRLSRHLLLFSGAGATDVRKKMADYFFHTALDRPFSPPREMRRFDIPRFANLIRAAYENY